MEALEYQPEASAQMTSLGLSFGLMLLVGILGLPFFGFRLLDTIMGHNTGVIWVVSALLVSPISAKYIK